MADRARYDQIETAYPSQQDTEGYLVSPMSSFSRKGSRKSKAKKPEKPAFTPRVEPADPLPVYDEIPICHAPNNPPRRQGIASHIVSWWWAEILACWVSVIAIAVQVAVLYRFNGQPQESWPSKTFPLNSFIALLATVCRGSLMVGVASALAQSKWTRFGHRSYRLSDYEILEDASRGSSGSFRVLWRFKGILHPSCIGAAITIASLGLSTFSQQLLTLRTDTVIIQGHPFEDLANVTRAINIDNLEDDNTGLGFRRPTMAMGLSVYNGFLAQSIPQMPMSCPSGDCTWPVFPSVGVCGACIDISSDIQHVKKPLPEGQFLDRFELPSVNDTISVGNSQNGFTLFNSSAVGNGRVFDKPGLEYLKSSNDTVFAQTTALGISKGTGFKPEAATAVECALWFCVQARNVSVRGGLTTDKVVDQWYKNERTPDPDSPSIFNISFVDIPASFGVVDKESFVLQGTAIKVMRIYMKDIMQGKFGDVSRSNDWIEGLYKSMNNTDAWVSRLTESMTNTLRQDNAVPASASAAYPGTVSTQQITIVVRWQWLTFPAICVILAIVYLAIEMTRTLHLSGSVRPWKDDALVPLYTSLDLDRNVLRKAAPGLDVPEGLHAELGDSHVKLRVGEDGELHMSGKIEAAEQAHGTYGRLEQGYMH